MANNDSKRVAKKNKEEVPPNQRAMSRTLAKRGLHTSHDFADIMGALFTDVVLGSISPDVCNAACNAGGKLLQVIALQHKYGSGRVNGQKTLILTSGANQ